MKEIALTKGFVAIVDDSDFKSVSALCWHASTRKQRTYAARKIRRADGSRGTQYLHQFLFPEAKEVDHWDGDGLNNQRGNLRPCTRSQNVRGFRRKPSGTHSQYRGVTWHFGAGKWVAQTRVNGKHIHLGYFSNEQDAAVAYDTAAVRIFGEFAAPNFPQFQSTPTTTV